MTIAVLSQTISVARYHVSEFSMALLLVSHPLTVSYVVETTFSQSHCSLSG